MAQTKRGTTTRRRSRQTTNTRGKLAKAAMSREMLAAGLAASAAAISASPKARQKIRDAGLDAADSAQAAASTMVTSASKLGSLIAEAVADAAQRVMSGKWDDNDASGQAKSRPGLGKSKPATSRGRIHEATITEGIGLSSSVEAKLVREVETMVAQSGARANFDAAKWVHDWIRHEVPALDGRRPIDLLDTMEGRALVSMTLARMQSGAYA
jgi:uncharacterized protein (DUF2384 family)